MNFSKKNLPNTLFFIIGDSIVILAAAYLVYLLLITFEIVDISFPIQNVLTTIFYSVISLGFFKMYQVNWRFTSLREILFIALGLASGTILHLLTIYITGSISGHLIVYSLFVLQLSILFVSAFRFSRRILTEVLNTPPSVNKAVIFGAGNAADQLMRDLTRHHQWKLDVLAIFDDNEKLHGLSMHGVRILGDRNKMYSYLRYTDIDELIIAIPSLPKNELKKVLDEVHSVLPNLKVKVLPAFHLLTDDPVGIKNIRQISIEDILGREPVRADITALEEFIAGKIVMITGAGGSIGSEMVRQCIQLNPSKIIALDIDETNLFHLLNEHSELSGILEPCVANITDKYKILQVFKKEVPDIIFHAAAYKHVPMMEIFPEEAVKVNIGGTKVLSKLACDFNVKKFVLISTDKAVNPTNVMGATKRVAEEVCLAYNELCVTKFIAVRFGNVLGSRGSVVPLFIEQIRNGGPLTITHKDVVRYFMTIPESVLLVMQAGMMGQGGEVFVLDMGEPVKIDDMARQLIRLHGLEPDRDIAIKYTGLRPGEKMFEELLKSEEDIQNTSHGLIYMTISSNNYSRSQIDYLTDQLLDKVKNGSANQARLILKQLVPSYSYNVKTG